MGTAYKRTSGASLARARKASENCHGLRLLQVVGELLERWLGEVCRLPQVGGQKAVSSPQRLERGLCEVPLGARVPARAGEHVGDTCEVHHLLHRRGTDDAAAPRCRDEAHTNRAALAVDLHRHCVRLADPITPIPPAERNEIHLGGDDAATDRSRHLLCALGSKTDVTRLVANQYIADEAVALPGRSHLLDRVDLHDLIFQVAWLEERIDDMILLDGEGMQVDVLDRADLPILNQTSQLGDWNPLLLLTFLALALALLPFAFALVLALALALVSEAAAFSKTALAHSVRDTLASK